MKLSLLFGVLVFSSLTGCGNLYSTLDAPTTDAQLLSKARSCFDTADYTCALSNYQKLSTASADTQASESALVVLDQVGINFGTFFTAFGTGAGAQGLNTLTKTLIPGSEAKRAIIYAGYQKALSIQSQSLRGFTRFVLGLAFVAELLAEDASSTGFLASDFVTDATTCKASLDPTVANLLAGITTCATSAGCAKPTSKTMVTGTSIDIDTTSPTGVPTLYMLNSGFSKILKGLLTELSVGGKFSAGTGTFVTVIDAASTYISASPNCYRWVLVKQGVGG
jgi:hypothetical protein